MRIRTLVPSRKNGSGSWFRQGKMDPVPGHEHFFTLTNFFNSQIIFKNFHLFFAYFMLKLRDKQFFNNISFFNTSDLGFESKSFFLQILADNFILWIHIFLADSDPDLVSQNVTDPDPKQCF